MLVNLTAFAVVREREVGTLEQIMVRAGGVHPRENRAIFRRRIGARRAHYLRGHPVVQDSIRRQSNGLPVRHHAVSFRSARPRTADLHDLFDPATGVRDELRRESALHIVGI